MALRQFWLQKNCTVILNFTYNIYDNCLQTISIDEIETGLSVASGIDATNTKVPHLQQTLFSSCLTRTCERAYVFENNGELYKRTSSSTIHFSVITELVSLGEDSLENIVYCFEKHTKEVCKKFYVQLWSTREAARLSWKQCHQMYSTENEKKAAQLREDLLSKTRSPEVDYIEPWIAKRIKLLKLTGTEVEDLGLMEIIKRFKDELHFFSVNGQYSLLYCMKISRHENFAVSWSS